MKTAKLFLLISAVVFIAGTALSIDAKLRGDERAEHRYAIAALAALASTAIASFKAKPVYGAAVTVLTRFSSASENNSFAGQGILAYVQAYAATVALVLKAAYKQHVCFAQLTGALTINATVTGLKQFDEVVLHFSADGTNRVVTFGTNFISTGTLTVTASKDATWTGVFDGVNIKEVSRAIGA